MALTKRLDTAYTLKNRAVDRSTIAERRVNSILDQLYTAMKDRDKAWAEQRKAEAHLRKVRKF